MWVGDCVDQVEGVVDVGYLVVQCFVYGVFQGIGVGGYWDYFGVQQFYVEDVGLLLVDVGGVYVDYVLQVEVCGDGGGGYVVYVGVGFGDDVFFVYVLGQEDLVDVVVDFVCVGMVQFFVFEVDFCFVVVFGQVFGEVKWVWLVDVVVLEVGQFFLECWVVFGFFVFVGEVEDQWYQGFGDVLVVEVVEQVFGVGVVVIGSYGGFQEMMYGQNLIFLLGKRN